MIQLYHQRDAGPEVSLEPIGGGGQAPFCGKEHLQGTVYSVHCTIHLIRHVRILVLFSTYLVLGLDEERVRTVYEVSEISPNGIVFVLGTVVRVLIHRCRRKGWERGWKRGGRGVGER